MNSDKEKYSFCFELINTCKLVNSINLLERERLSHTFFARVIYTQNKPLRNKSLYLFLTKKSDVLLHFTAPKSSYMRTSFAINFIHHAAKPPIYNLFNNGCNIKIKPECQ